MSVLLVNLLAMQQTELQHKPTESETPMGGAESNLHLTSLEKRSLRTIILTKFNEETVRQTQIIIYSVGLNSSEKSRAQRTEK